MADNSNNILNQLQQYITEPPAGAFEKAWQAIVQNELPVERNDDAERKVFGQLQNHAIASPALDFAAVSGTQVKKSAVVIPAYWLRAAASVILLLAAGSIVYFTLFRKKESPQNNYAGPGIIKDSAAITATTGVGDTLNKNLTKVNSIVAATVTAATIKPPQKKNSTRNNFALNKKENGTSKPGSSEGQLYENDVLLTLVNYKSHDWQQFFTKAVTEKKITLNNYSYHNLSDKMVELLQDIYLVKSNGKPSRKAKKTKRKFEKWRKKDEKYFDKDLQKNPADIIDLSEFILKNN